MPKRSPAAKSSRTARPSAGVTGQDLDVARRDALLQLKIGRSAHLLTVGVSVLLGLDAIALLFFFSPLPSLAPSDHGLSALVTTLYILLPLLGAVAIAAVGLGTKWGEFRLWPWEGHFSVSAGGLLVGALTAALYFGRVAGYGPWGSASLFPHLIALSFATITLSLLGLALTWRPWGSRQWASAACALLPLATALLVYFPPTQAGIGSEPLVVALLISAVLYQTSGSFLHLLSSGTPVHRQAVVLSGQDRIGRLAGEVRQKEEALRFRELAVIKREADAETAEATARRAQELSAASKERLESLDTELRERADELAKREREVAGGAAELDGRTRILEDREKAAEAKAQQLERAAAELNERATSVSRSAGEQAQHEVELRQLSSDVRRKASEFGEREQRLASREKQLEEKTAELLRREGDITARELSAGGTKKGGPTPPEQDLAAREARARHLKTLLDEQNTMLGQRAQEVAAQARQAETTLRQATERQAALAAREAALAQKESDLHSRLRSAEERRAQSEQTLKDYRDRVEAVTRQQADLARKAVDVDRTMKTLPEREKVLSDREAKLASALAEIERREGALHSRERTSEANEAELSFRLQELDRAIADVQGPEPPARGLPRTSEPRSGGRGEAATRPATAGVPAGPKGGAVSEPQTIPGTLAAQQGRRYGDRLPSGTPRLDDLLLGGLPPKSHVALVGEAFVGKEVALYAFVAEGLKRGEPVVLVTATRSPDEISESLGVLLPQFREYEQIGKVTWIDASGSGAAAGPHRLVTAGSNDLPGILSALVQASKDLSATPPGRFRVGFLGLSAALAHGEERAGFAFLQNIVGILKPRDALAMYSIEAGALSEPQVESLLGRMDGAILFRQDRDRTFLSVKGFGDVETREWIECRASNRALVIGSFALERIR